MVGYGQVTSQYQFDGTTISRVAAQLTSSSSGTTFESIGGMSSTGEIYGRSRKVIDPYVEYQPIGDKSPRPAREKYDWIPTIWKEPSDLLQVPDFPGANDQDLVFTEDEYTVTVHNGAGVDDHASILGVSSEGTLIGGSWEFQGADSSSSVISSPQNQQTYFGLVWPTASALPISLGEDVRPSAVCALGIAVGSDDQSNAALWLKKTGWQKKGLPLYEKKAEDQGKIPYQINDKGMMLLGAETLWANGFIYSATELAGQPAGALSVAQLTQSGILLASVNDPISQNEKGALLLPFEFKETFPASGFDKYTEPNWLMVPQHNNNWAKAYTPASAGSTVQFRVAPGPGGATVYPESTSISPETLTVSSPTVGDDTAVEIGIGTAFGTGGLKLAVKRYRHKTVAIHAVTQRYTTPMPLAPNEGKPDQICVQGGSILWSTPGGDDQQSGYTITTGANGICETTADSHDTQIIPVGQGICKDLVPAGVPSETDFETYLNKVFGIQANIYFTVTRTDKVMDYDIAESEEEPRNKMLDMTGSLPFGPEETILQTGAGTPGVDINIYFVHSFNYGNAIGKAVPPRVAYVKNTNADLKQVAVHEIGHCLGIPYHANELPDFNPAFLKGKDATQRLMYAPYHDIADPVLIKAEWDLINKDNE